MLGCSQTQFTTCTRDDDLGCGAGPSMLPLTSCVWLALRKDEARCPPRGSNGRQIIPATSINSLHRLPMALSMDVGHDADVALASPRWWWRRRSESQGDRWRRHVCCSSSHGVSRSDISFSNYHHRTQIVGSIHPHTAGLVADLWPSRKGPWRASSHALIPRIFLCGSVHGLAQII